MAELTILRRVRESQERARMAPAPRRSRTETALLLSAVVVGGCFLYNAITPFVWGGLHRGRTKPTA